MSGSKIFLSILVRCLAGVLFIPSLEKAYGQPDATLSKRNRSDSFIVSISTCRNGTSDSPNFNTPKPPKLAYDFECQYPLYVYSHKQIRYGDKLEISIRQTPASGWLYFYILDADNTPRVFPALRLDSGVEHQNIHLDPSAIWAGPKHGRRYLVFWYSTDSIENAGDFIMGVEFTMGPFVRRNNRQLGRRLLPPLDGWHFMDHSAGFVIDNRIKEKTRSFVLPLIIMLDTKKGMRTSLNEGR